MSEVRYIVVRPQGGWRVVDRGRVSPSYPSLEIALRAAAHMAEAMEKGGVSARILIQDRNYEFRPARPIDLPALGGKAALAASRQLAPCEAPPSRFRADLPLPPIGPEDDTRRRPATVASGSPQPTGCAVAPLARRAVHST